MSFKIPREWCVFFNDLHSPARCEHPTRKGEECELHSCPLPRQFSLWEDRDEAKEV